MSYHGMWLTRTCFLLAGYKTKPMMTTKPTNIASLVSGKNVENNVIPMQ